MVLEGNLKARPDLPEIDPEAIARGKPALIGLH